MGLSDSRACLFGNFNNAAPPPPPPSPYVIRVFLPAHYASFTADRSCCGRTGASTAAAGFFLPLFRPLIGRTGEEREESNERSEF